LAKPNAQSRRATVTPGVEASLAAILKREELRQRRHLLPYLIPGEE
jgi:hypothetical protein